VVWLRRTESVCQTQSEPVCQTKASLAHAAYAQHHADAVASSIALTLLSKREVAYRQEQRRSASIIMPLTIKTNALEEPDKKRRKTNNDSSDKTNAVVVDPLVKEFETFMKKLPSITNEWREANGVSTKNTPSGLKKHVNDTLFVLTHKTTENGNLLLGAYMHRLNRRKKVQPYDLKCKLVMEFDITGNIFRKWTDWEPNASVERMRPGLFVHITRCFLHAGKMKIHVFQDGRDISNTDSYELTEMENRYTHFLSKSPLYFPPTSGWN